MSRRSSIRLILFDLDDTLCDYASSRALRLRLAFSRAAGEAGPGIGAGARAPHFDVERMIAESIETNPHGADHFPGLFRRHGIGGDLAAVRAIDWYRRNRFLGLKLFDEALESISALRACERAVGRPERPRIGLVTNGPADTQRDKISLLGLDRAVDFAVVSGEVGAWKPDQRIFSEALGLGEAEPGETVFIGDSPEHDVMGAQAVGIRAIWLNRTAATWPPELNPPDDEIATLSELATILGIGPGVCPEIETSRGGKWMADAP